MIHAACTHTCSAHTAAQAQARATRAGLTSLGCSRACGNSTAAYCWPTGSQSHRSQCCRSYSHHRVYQHQRQWVYDCLLCMQVPTGCLVTAAHHCVRKPQCRLCTTCLGSKTSAFLGWPQRVLSHWRTQSSRGGGSRIGDSHEAAMPQGVHHPDIAIKSQRQHVKDG